MYRVVITDAQIHGALDDWSDALKQADGRLHVFQSVSAEQVERCCIGADAVLNAGAPLSAAAITVMPHCRIIARLGAGYDNIDVEAATAAGIAVTNVPGFCDHEVADHTMALLLACSRQIVAGDQLVRAGRWERFHMMPAFRLAGRVMGIVGFGRIGQHVARRAAAFGMRVVFHDPYLVGQPQAPAEPLSTLEELLAGADVVSLHVPLTPATRGMIGAAEFRLMKPSAYLINCARGGVVAERDLVTALSQGWIARAGLDVFENEPPARDNPLLSMPNVVLSPHCAAHTIDAMQELRRRGFEEVLRALRGQPLRHVVNPEALNVVRTAGSSHESS